MTASDEEAGDTRSPRPDVLAPDARRILEKIAALNQPNWEDIGVERARTEHESYPDSGGTADVASVSEHLVPGPHPVRVRVYRPRALTTTAPVLFIHGGGWVLGSLASYDSTCRRITAAAGCCTVSVEYRLAPEHPFPAGLEDCYQVLSWLAEHASEFGADPDRLVVAGDSAGGNLAAAVVILARDRGGPTIASQILIYPITDFDLDSGSMLRNADGYMLRRATMSWFYDLYCPPSRRGEGAAAPLRAPDLGRLPAAHFVLAGYDPLFDEGVAYARRLTEAGITTTCSIYPGQFHGFFTMTRFLADARRAQAEVVDAIGRSGRA